MKKLLVRILFLLTFCTYYESKYFNYEALQVIKDYEEGLEKAKVEGKPIFLYFTCHGCMGDYRIERKQILGDWKTYKKLRDEFINVWLYVDDRKKIEPYISPLSGRTIKAIGNKWADLQYEKFGEQSQPLFIILNKNGERISANQIGYSQAKDGGLLAFWKVLNNDTFVIF